MLAATTRLTLHVDWRGKSRIVLSRFSRNKIHLFLSCIGFVCLVSIFKVGAVF
jgi:hypothetical protein